MNADVPSPIDFCTMSDAREWERTAMEKRPWRIEFFAKFAEELLRLAPSLARLLELGSGPGFLAEHLLRALPDVHLVLLDFSPVMHQLAKHRLGPLVNRVEFIERNFKEPDWVTGLGQFDAVITMQSVHELRHKRHAAVLHKRVKSVLRSGGSYLVCDHIYGAGGMSDSQLYMTAEEQKAAIASADFTAVREILNKGGLVLHHAT